MQWILFFVLPVTVTAHNPATMRDASAYAGMPMMAYAASFDTKAQCDDAGKHNYLQVDRLPGSFYICTQGFKTSK